MLPPSAGEMLGAWERGHGQAIVARGLTLLALACPGEAPDALARLSIGARDRRLLALRAAAFGPRMRGLVVCPACGEQLETELDATVLAAEPAAVPLPLCIAADGYDVQVRLPDSRDLIACAELPPAEAAVELLRHCIVSAERQGAPVAAEDLPEALTERIGERMAAADPQAEMQLALDCAACRHRWSVPFEIVTFLWAELDAWAGRLLQDIHQLAGAYGWSERDIIGLGPVRRDRYLQMLGR